MAQKNAKKVSIFSNATLFCNKIDAKLKKGASVHLQFLMLFQTKNILDFMLHFG
jgi:hypothetical protein